MAKVLSFPFRVGQFGAALTVEQGNETYYKEQIGCLLLTKQGERPIRPNFGMPDIVFSGFQYSSFQSQVQRELPEVTNITATIVEINDTTETVVVNFDIAREF